ncbi:hypothetical protein FACS189440_11610 [Bacteroidia bacterium]|nr:hypothetical protein FACS189440_11610 [Bacteroidia bacterium]
MFDNVKQYGDKETVYPDKYVTATPRVGYERVEIELLGAGGVPANELPLGKAVKTLVIYDNDDKELLIDSIVSSVNVTGLTESKTYTFTVYSVDEYGNRSVPISTSAMPFTASDLGNLLIANPVVVSSPSAALIQWINGISSASYDYYGLSYSYTGKDGAKQEGSPAETKFSVTNLKELQVTTVDVKHKLIPKVNNVAILDTLYVERPVDVKTITEAEFEEVKKGFLDKTVSEISFYGAQSALIHWTGANIGLLKTELKYNTKSGKSTSLDIELHTTQTYLKDAEQKPAFCQYRSVFTFEPTGEIFYGDWLQWSLPQTSLYLVGDAIPAKFDPLKGIEFPFDPGNPYVYTGRLALNTGSFRFLSKRELAGLNVRPVDKYPQDQLTPGATYSVQLYSNTPNEHVPFKDKNFYNQEAGTYDITVDLNNLTVHYEKAN